MASQATANALKKLVVVGGNGFLGSRICRAAVNNGLEVVSLSRSGVAPNFEAWTKKVTWQKADALTPDTYKETLMGAAGVVHSIGILLENSKYQQFLKPDSDHLTSAKQATSFEKANRDTCIALATTAEKLGVKKFVYISAAGAPPFVDPRYISTKREAETALRQMTKLDSVIFRPGFIYDEDDIVSNALGLSLKKMVSCLESNLVKSLLQSWVKGNTITKPLNVVTVAEAVVQAVLLPECKGIVELDGIVKLAGQS